MKFKSTWAFLIFALAFGAYIYFIEIKKAAKDEEAKAESEKIFAVDADKVKALLIKNTNGTFDLEKNAQNIWQIKSPMVDLADEQVVTALLSSLVTERFEEVVSEGEADLKPYGLEAPQESVTLTLADGSIKKLDIGNDGAISGKVYVQRVGEKKVLFANSSIKTQIEKNLKDLRDKKIFKNSKGDISSMILKFNRKDNQNQVSLVKGSGDVKWTMESPLKTLADQDVVASYLMDVESFRAMDFVSEEAGVEGHGKKVLQEFKLDKPELDLSFFDKDKKIIKRLLVSSKKDAAYYVYVYGKPTIYHVAANLVDALVKKVDAFRDKKSAFEFTKDEVTEIIYKTAIVNLHLVRKGLLWEQIESEAKASSSSGGTSGTQDKVNQEQVGNFLDRLKQFKTSEFIEGETPKELQPPGGPKGTITLKDSKGALLLTYNWGGRTNSGKAYYIRTSKAKVASGIDAALIDTMPGQTLIEAKAPAAGDASAVTDAHKSNASGVKPIIINPAKVKPEAVKPGSSIQDPRPKAQATP